MNNSSYLWQSGPELAAANRVLASLLCVSNLGIFQNYLNDKNKRENTQLQHSQQIHGRRNRVGKEASPTPSEQQGALKTQVCHKCAEEERDRCSCCPAGALVHQREHARRRTLAAMKASVFHGDFCLFLASCLFLKITGERATCVKESLFGLSMLVKDNQ